MEFKLYNDVEEYREKVKYFLEQEEVVNNLPLGILQNLLKPKQAQTQDYKQEPFLALIEDEGVLVLVLLMTPPHNLYVYGRGLKLEQAICFAVERLSSINIALPGVIGPKDVADLFAKQWEKEKSVTPVIGMNQRIYQLKEVKLNKYSSGTLRAATQNDVSLLTDWIHEFSKVTFSTLTEEDCLIRAMRMIEQRTVCLWQDGERVVSMVNRVRPTENGITVSYVYTPPVYERKGYATSCVAAFSQLLLNEGYKYCTLYTDLDNPTSNSIYMKIGYEPIRDSVMYEFVT